MVFMQQLRAGRSGLTWRAFNLFAIEDNSRLDNSLLERLKNKDQFQGARHEVFAEATFLRAGFQIEHEDQKDPTRRHAEFTA